MKKQGFSTSFSVAITACSSVMGVIIPPSIMMVVWGGLMSVSIGGLFLAGVVPGVLIAASQMLAVYIYAKSNNYEKTQRSNLKELFVALIQAIPPLMTPVIIVGGIVGGIFTPTEASAVAVVYSLLLGVIGYRTLNLSKVVKAFYEAGRFSAVSLFCVGTASAFGWLLAYYKVPLAIVEFLKPFGVGPVSTGLIIAGAFLFIGMFIDAIPAIIILGTVLLPLAQYAGIHDIHFAIIGVVSLAFGLVSPPYGLCLMISCAIGEIKIIDALRDVFLILIPMLLILLVIILLPDLILYLPRLLMPRFM
jgi:tripartite ATP-independent transporter DctM subunit